MRCLTVLLSLGFLVIPSFAQPPVETTENKPTTTPEEQIKTSLTKFINQLNNASDFGSMQESVADARAGFYGANDWFKTWQKRRDNNQFVIVEITVGDVKANSATALVTYQRLAKGKVVVDKAPLYKETLNLRRKGWDWQVVAFTTRQELWKSVNGESSSLRSAIFELAQNEWNYSPEYRGQHSLLQLKQLSLGVLQFAVDYNRFAFAPEYAQEALWPYLQNDALFNILGTKETYTFNGLLSGKRMNEIREPKYTVMFYEGQDERPVFRYDGKAAIGFVDGHCALVTPTEADDLIWK